MRSITSNLVKTPLLELQEKARGIGIDFTPFARRSINKFDSLPNDVRIKIYDGLNEWLEIFREVDTPTNRLDYELALLSKAERDLGLSIPDDFKKVIEPDDIIEIYDLECERQIYRNMQFLKDSSYDLMMITTHQWHELFERSAGYDELVKKRTFDVALESETVQPWGVEVHFLKEKLDPKQRVFKMKMGYLSPVYRQNTSERVAWASTLQVELVGSALDEAGNVSPLY